MLQLTKTQLENIENKSMLMLPISDYDLNRIDKGYSIGDSFPVQKDDKDIWIAEEFLLQAKDDGSKYIVNSSLFDIVYRASCDNGLENFYYVWQSASKMTKEQSRYTISEMLDVRIVRIKEVDIFIAEDLGIDIDNAIDGKELDEAYRMNSNPYHLPMYAECPFIDIRERVKNYYNQILKEHNINRTYEDNDYIFLVEYKY